MRLVTFRSGDAIQVGVVVGDEVVPLDRPADSDMTALLAAGDAALSAAERIDRGGSSPKVRHKLRDVQLLAPVTRPGKIVAVGLNYRDHAMETKMAIPTVPILFAKFNNSITGPEAPVALPVDDSQVDYEAEMAVVIGRTAKGVSEADAMNFVAGYMPLNDVTQRKWQFADKQWVRGKSCDTFCPIGPWLTTRDAVPDPHALAIRMRVNGTELQSSNTSNLIFGVPALVEFISQAITLDPGDIIATGTPGGVGFTRQPPIFLKRGDVMEVEIEGLGVLRNHVV